MTNYNITVFASSANMGKTKATLAAAITAAISNPTKRVLYMVDANGGLPESRFESFKELQPTNLSIVLRNETQEGADNHQDVVDTVKYYDIVALDISSMGSMIRFDLTPSTVLDTFSEPDVADMMEVLLPNDTLKTITDSVDYLYIARPIVTASHKEKIPLVTFSTRI